MKVILTEQEICDLTYGKAYEVKRWLKHGDRYGYQIIDDAGDKRELRREYFIKANMTLDNIFVKGVL